MIDDSKKNAFWLDIGPASGYIGTTAFDAAVQNGDASPDAARLGWQGAERGCGANEAPSDCGCTPDAHCGCGGQDTAGAPDHGCGCGEGKLTGAPDHGCGEGKLTGAPDHGCGCGEGKPASAPDHGCGCGEGKPAGAPDHGCGCGKNENGAQNGKTSSARSEKAQNYADALAVDAANSAVPSRGTIPAQAVDSIPDDAGANVGDLSATSAFDLPARSRAADTGEGMMDGDEVEGVLLGDSVDPPRASGQLPGSVRTVDAAAREYPCDDVCLTAPWLGTKEEPDPWEDTTLPPTVPSPSPEGWPGL